MYYEFLEDVAQTNRLRDVHPVIKIILGLGCILIAVSSQSIIAPLFIVFTISFATIFLAGIDVGLYRKLLMIPVGFAVIGVLVILFMRNSGDTVFSYPLFGSIVLTVSTGSINESLLILSRVFAGMCSLFFISLTTPVTETFQLAAKCHIPNELIDLSMLIYRFIFVFIEQAEQIYNAQVMRLGYGNLKEGIDCFGMMSGALFINTWDAGENLLRAMDSRCYDGKFALLDDDVKFSYSSFVCVIIYLIVVIAIAVATSGYTVFGVN
ncbi:cobalt/nickel transport system permease protein [Methanomicrobium sp. W14]|uniref:cobalt ECF transporter T component CbiQ n=1 Tax=Methanomicrobium sp. W14 TaxID=2817839 RepID=UPI001AE7210C|nr:cobalt ECF transporter T component CbiQ [Methanomicrobium sp. W14]MBP2132759.1 cobalt/nickel transport system permease protein [Methanomicrobium sp. W14]